MKKNKISTKIFATFLAAVLLFSGLSLTDFAKQEVSARTETKKVLGCDDLYVVSKVGYINTDGVITCAANKSYFAMSENFLGDNYGLYGGNLSMELLVTGGTYTIGLRDVSEERKRTDNCVKFEFKDGVLTLIDTFTEEEIQIATGLFADEKAIQIEFVDAIDTITVNIDGKTACVVEFYWGDTYEVSNYYCTMTVKDGEGKELGKVEKTQQQKAGRFSLLAKTTEGYVTDIKYDYTEITETELHNAGRTVNYSNWVATDDLDRETEVATVDEDTTKDRAVGVFYFLQLNGNDGFESEYFDCRKLWLDLGCDYDAMDDFISENHPGLFWSEPYFGYYRNTDEWVIRKHAYMLEQAGVDFIFLDYTNELTYDKATKKLCDIWLQIREEGNDTPQICILCPESTTRTVNVLKHMFDEDNDTIYSGDNWDKYKELFFCWDGLPLILGDYNSMKESTRANYIDGRFTMRGCWAWTGGTNYWSWMSEMQYSIEDDSWYMVAGLDENGEFEQLSITLGHHASTSKGRSFVHGEQLTDGENDYEFNLSTSGEGLGFASMAEYVLEADPAITLITGWNEWYAGYAGESSYMANTSVTNYVYVDTFNPEFSRDGEPMKQRQGEEAAFGDNYYYQICDFIRKYKGQTALESASGELGGEATSATSWTNVGPEFQDNIGDNVLRSSIGYSANWRYLNNTGRNDFDTCKVTEDGDYIYFYAQTVDDITAPEADGDAEWMNLYIDIDMDNTTGWEGYDFAINRSRTDSKVSVDKFTDNSWNFKNVGEAEYSVDGNVIVIKVKKSLLGLNSKGSNFDFKWADNSTTDGDVMHFMDLGDTAPNDRFNYRYINNTKEYASTKEGKTGCRSSISTGIVSMVCICAFAVVALRKKKEKTL